MKNKVLILLVILASVTLLYGCKKQDTLLIWVGDESQEFYQGIMDEYVTAYNEANDEDFPYLVSVKGVDTGSAAATFLEDTDAGADIFTVAHDNLGKLITGSSSIAPITDPDLLAQIAADNPATFADVIKGSVGGTEYTFGVPYIAQALVLYYNKEFITEQQVLTWEGILAAAATANKQALSLTGTDGFNNSFLLLAKNATTQATSLRLYADGDINENYATGDDVLSVLKWGQRFFTNPNGAKRPTDSGWTVEIQNEISIAVIGGAWHFNAAQAALGSNLGVTKLPTFTVTSQDVYGSTPAGTEFQSGTFADAKMFVMKKGSDKAAYLQDIMMHLSSKEIQEQSFTEANNLPSYKNAKDEFDSMTGDSVEIQLAVAQLEMFERGIPQPFGADTRFNFYYYSKGAPDLIMEILENKNDLFDTDAAILAQMLIVEAIWKTGVRPTT